ncbi:hypothetical protein HMPREF1981_03515 [Bacteroides pyogenes F0041]|uniref:Uncharacterized protein n=1 Tax=Bacteroides pyogenes F0041 TaxID=1321819 RepID=U2BS11_9BACE|nr:hypothetical protein HMPREF1981_03515 [Bacteroides pyogenes F0041]
MFHLLGVESFVLLLCRLSEQTVKPLLAVCRSGSRCRSGGRAGIVMFMRVFGYFC